MAVQILALQQRATANDANGNPLAGAKIYTYQTGTTTPLATYTTSALSTLNANPIEADAAGRFGPIYTNGSVAVKCVITTAADVTVDTLDPAPFAYDSQSGASSISHTPNALLTSDTVQGALDQVTTELRTQAFYYATAGGTVDAITLTTNVGIPALVAGMMVQFNPTGNNTGTVTINVDGLGAQPVRTMAGSVLPAEYLIARTTVLWTGSQWLVVDRPPNRASNANGSWTRFPDGTQICRNIVTTVGGTVTWTFPRTFNAAPNISATPVSAGTKRAATVSSVGTTTAVVEGWTTAGATWDGTIQVMAIGTWF